MASIRHVSVRRASATTGSVVALVLAVLLLAVASGVVMAAVPHDSSFFLPSVCLVNGTDSDSCCPESFGEVCGGPQRGVCSDIMSTDSVCDTTNHAAGLWWFSDFFTQACVCAEGFGGVACSTCRPGYQGDWCNITTVPVVRRDFATMSDEEQQLVVSAIKLLGETPNTFHPDVSQWQFIVAMHVWSMQGVAKAPTGSLSGTSLGYGHGGPAAPTWHRAFSSMMETAIQQVTGNATFGLPYWDWSHSSGNNADPAIRLLGGDGDPNSLLPGYPCRTRGEESLTGCNCTVTQGPFAGLVMLGEWGLPLPGSNRVLSRSFGCHEPSLPTADVVSFIANLTYYNSTNYESFRPMVGGLTMHPQSVYTWPPSEDGIDMHARVHRWMGGTMMGDFSPNDPIFFLHHSFVDLIFERWIRNGIEAGTFGMDNALPVVGGPVGHNLYECVGPFFPLRTHAEFFRDSRELGYTYDYFITAPDDHNEQTALENSPLQPHLEERNSSSSSSLLIRARAPFTAARAAHLERLLPKKLSAARAAAEASAELEAEREQQRTHTRTVAHARHKAAQRVHRARIDNQRTGRTDADNPITAEAAAQLREQLPAWRRPKSAAATTAKPSSGVAASSSKAATSRRSTTATKAKATLSAEQRRAARARAKREFADALKVAQQLVPNDKFK